jgi:hypothetical protein
LEEENFLFRIPMMVPCPLPLIYIRHPIKTWGLWADSCINAAGDVLSYVDPGVLLSMLLRSEVNDPWSVDRVPPNNFLATRKVLTLEESVNSSPGLVMREGDDVLCLIEVDGGKISGEMYRRRSWGVLALVLFRYCTWSTKG